MLQIAFRVVIFRDDDLEDDYISMHKRIFDDLCVFFRWKRFSPVPTVEMVLLIGHTNKQGFRQLFLTVRPLEPQTSYKK